MKGVDRDLLEVSLQYNKKCYYASIAFAFLFVSVVPVSPLMFLLSLSSLSVAFLYSKEVGAYEQQLKALDNNNSD